MHICCIKMQQSPIHLGLEDIIRWCCLLHSNLDSFLLVATTTDVYSLHHLLTTGNLVRNMLHTANVFFLLFSPASKE
jgi:hypothetical protein